MIRRATAKLVWLASAAVMALVAAPIAFHSATQAEMDQAGTQLAAGKADFINRG